MKNEYDRRVLFFVLNKIKNKNKKEIINVVERRRCI